MTGVTGLRGLLAQATPGAWVVDADPENLDVRGEHAIARIAGPMTMGEDADPGVKARAQADARLIALAPDMARLLVDMAAYIDGRAEGTWQEYEALLARFAEIERRAAQ